MIRRKNTSSSRSDLQIEYRSIGSLKPRDRNPRTHTKKQIRQIADSIKAFGFTNPVLVDDEDHIAAGHGRVEAAKLLGFETVPTIRLEGMTEAELRAYVIADNSLAERAGWDEELLAIEFQYFAEVDIDFDLTVTGFETAEIDLLIEGLSSTAEDPSSDAIPDMGPSAPPVSKPGDLWRLGRHRLLCGDATSAAAFGKAEIAMRRGEDVPPGWVIDSEGRDSQDPNVLTEGGMLLPLGSTRELGSHKGYGLATAVEILCSVLSGAGFGMSLPRTHYRHYVAAYDVAAFTDVAEFKQTMDDFIGELKATPPAPGQERVMVAGQPEWEAEAEHRAHGIPLHHEVVDWFRGTCAEMGVPCAI